MKDNGDTTLLEDGLLTIRQASEFCGLSRSDLYERMGRGELAYCRIGKRRLVPKRALIELARRGLVYPTVRPPT